MSYPLPIPNQRSRLQAFWEGFCNGISFFMPISYSLSNKELKKSVRKIMDETSNMAELGDTEYMNLDAEVLKKYFEEALIQTCDELPEKKSPARS